MGSRRGKTVPYYAKSKTTEWQTPQSFFDLLHAEFRFTLDVCAVAGNAKTPAFYSSDSLSTQWTGTCWMNPPYGRQIDKWIRKAVESARDGATVVCLVPARTDTVWFHEFCIPFGEIRFVKNRLYFGDGKERAPFPSMVVVFRPKLRRLNRTTACSISNARMSAKRKSAGTVSNVKL